MQGRILIQTGESSFESAIAEMLRRQGLRPEICAELDQAQELLDHNPDISLALLSLPSNPNSARSDMIARLVESHQLPVVLLVDSPEVAISEESPIAQAAGVLPRSMSPQGIATSLRLTLNFWQQTQARLRQQINREESLYSSLVNALPVLLYRTDLQGKITYANETLLQEMNLKLKDLLGKTAHDFYPPELAEKYRRDDQQVIRSGVPLRTIEENVNPADGISRFVEVIKVPVFETNNVTGVQGVFWDVTSQIRARNTLESALDEKQTLLRELHHRIRNNIASLASLITLQIQSAKNQEAKDLLEEVVHLLSTMGVMYDHLLPGSEKDSLSLNQYLQELLHALGKILSQNIEISLIPLRDDMELPANSIISLGIMVNELVTNSVKHGYSAEQNGEVTVALGIEGPLLSMEVSDRGKGMPSSFRLEDSKGFGLELVDMLVRQWDGHMSINGHRGTSIKLGIPLESVRAGQS
tara:strand:- start:36389 stop:37801 length:1413 start_codon:yes stop_codon:yes gene_type:complete